MKITKTELKKMIRSLVEEEIAQLVMEADSELILTVSSKRGPMAVRMLSKIISSIFEDTTEISNISDTGFIVTFTTEADLQEVKAYMKKKYRSMGTYE